MAQKVVIFGNSGTGKSTTLANFIGLPLPVGPTMGVSIHPYFSPAGNAYNLWEVGGFGIAPAGIASVAPGTDLVLLFWNPTTPGWTLDVWLGHLITIMPGVPVVVIPSGPTALPMLHQILV